MHEAGLGPGQQPRPRPPQLSHLAPTHPHIALIYCTAQQTQLTVQCSVGRAYDADGPAGPDQPRQCGGQLGQGEQEQADINGVTGGGDEAEQPAHPALHPGLQCSRPHFGEEESLFHFQAPGTSVLRQLQHSVRQLQHAEVDISFIFNMV